MLQNAVAVVFCNKRFQISGLSGVFFPTMVQTLAPGWKKNTFDQELKKLYFVPSVNVVASMSSTCMKLFLCIFCINLI